MLHYVDQPLLHDLCGSALITCCTMRLIFYHVTIRGSTLFSHATLRGSTLITWPMQLSPYHVLHCSAQHLSHATLLGSILITGYTALLKPYHMLHCVVQPLSHTTLWGLYFIICYTARFNTVFTCDTAWINPYRMTYAAQPLLHVPLLDLILHMLHCAVQPLSNVTLHDSTLITCYFVRLISLSCF